MTLAFRHLRETENTGDLACCPYDYFSWPGATVGALIAVVLVCEAP